MKCLALFALLTATAVGADTSKISMVSPADAATRVAEGRAVLIDVREPAEWEETGVAEPAALLPMSDLLGEQKLWKPFLEENSGKELLLYCRSGNRSGKVAERLGKEGHSVANAGAFKDWTAAGLPVRKP